MTHWNNQVRIVLEFQVLSQFIPVADSSTFHFQLDDDFSNTHKNHLTRDW